MLLTQRAEDIIRVLIRFPQNSPVTTAVISEELHLSSRSIQRELPCVEEWLTGNGYNFVRKRSVGLLIDEPDERRQEILSLLSQEKGASLNAEDRKDRRWILCQELLFSDDPLKSFYFTDKLGISEGTLTNELNYLDNWFQKYKLTLIRKPGLGIFLTGNETAYRQAVTAFLYERVSRRNMDLPRLDDSTSRSSVQIPEISEQITSTVSRILNTSEEQLNLHLSDRGYLNLMLYLSYSIHRIQQGRVLGNFELMETDLSIEPEFAVADHLIARLRQEFGLPFLETEVQYLTTFLTGIRIWPSSRRDLTSKRDFDMHQITLTIMRCVGEYLETSFSDDPKLPIELGAHLQPTIGRLRAGIPIENPMLTDFQHRYSEVFQACEAGCSALSDLYDLPPFPDSEIGFITIYFVMALDRKAKQARRISALIVCPTGIGSSRLLAENLKKEYPDLDILGTMSAFDINDERLTSNGIDVIISTIKLDTTYRWIEVNPILTRQDKLLLESKLKNISKHKKEQKSIASSSFAAPLSKKEVDYIASLGDCIYEVLDNIRFRKASLLHTKEELYSCAASLFAKSAEQEEHFYQVIQERDTLADTYTKPFRALLLHGKSTEITKPCFGYVRLDPPLYENTRITLGAIVSLIPANEPSNISSSVASEIIGGLLEDTELLKTLWRCDAEKFKKLLEVHLLRFYRSQTAAALSLPYK